MLLELAKNMHRNNCRMFKVGKIMVKAVYLLGSIFVASGCSAQDIETKNYISDQLGKTDVEINCSLSSLQSKISTLNKASGTTEFDVMLSFGQRKDDEIFSIMKKSIIRDEFTPGKEAAVFLSNDKRIVTVAKFNKQANVNLFLKASTACDKESGDICTPILYYDGSKEYCLMLSGDELAR